MEEPIHGLYSALRVGRTLLASEKHVTGGGLLVYALASVALVIMSGLMAGLTLGLLSLDVVDLEVYKRSGSAKEKAWATRIEPVLKNPHFLLVTLLLCNAAAMETLPICLDRIFAPAIAIVLSVTVVLLFGEIIPQAVCAKYGLAIGAFMAWPVRFLMLLCSPIAWPVSKLLDYALGEESALFRRNQLKALVHAHAESEALGGDLTQNEVHVIAGALDLTNKTARAAMTPLEKVFMVPDDADLNEQLITEILATGHSRVPVYTDGDRNAIIGLILVKELILTGFHAQNGGVGKVRDMKMRSIPQLSADTPMYDLLKLFQTGRSHMVLLTQPHMVAASSEPLPVFAEYHGKPLGIITIEDVIEELLGEEIIDETDLYIDNMQVEKVNAARLITMLPEKLKKVVFAGVFTPRVGQRSLDAAMTRASPPGRSGLLYSRLNGSAAPLLSNEAGARRGTTADARIKRKVQRRGSFPAPGEHSRADTLSAGHPSDEARVQHAIDILRPILQRDATAPAAVVVPAAAVVPAATPPSPTDNADNV